MNATPIIVTLLYSLGQTAASAQTILINEVDADQAGADTAEFVELSDQFKGNTSLDGLVLVFFDGADDASYLSFDLDGWSTNTEGYFVLCNDAANVPNCDLSAGIPDNMIQNGADAIALFVGDATAFPEDTPVTTTNLLDALVYDTNDDDDAALLVLVKPGQPQINEDQRNDKDGHSNQRWSNVTQVALEPEDYTQALPTPGERNVAIGVSNERGKSFPERVSLDQNYPNPFNPETTISYSIARTGLVELKVYNVLGELVQVLENRVHASGEYGSSFDASGLATGIYFYTLSAGGVRQTRKMVALR